MPEKKKLRLISLILGGLLLAGAIIGVIFLKWNTAPEAEPPQIRPVKTIMVGASQDDLLRQYPGRVDATERVDLAFQVDGQLIEFPIKKGQNVKKGDLLGRLDPNDYKNILAAKKAIYDERTVNLKRTEDAFKVNAATVREVDDAKATRDVAKAEMDIAQKALNDTCLRAPFDGVIANTYVDNYENVRAKQKVLSLQDVTSVEIDVNIPEQRVALNERAGKGARFVATFDYLPGREFDVKLKEFATEADPKTQTYLATFVMPAPKDVTILPGMTATIREYRKLPETDKGQIHLIPIVAVPIDGDGQYYVWVLTDKQDDTYAVHRVNVKVGEMSGSDIYVISNDIHRGDRIAVAGVHILREGQRVRIWHPKKKGDNE